MSSAKGARAEDGGRMERTHVQALRSPRGSASPAASTAASAASAASPIIASKKRRASTTPGDADAASMASPPPKPAQAAAPEAERRQTPRKAAASQPSAPAVAAAAPSSAGSKAPASGSSSSTRLATRSSTAGGVGTPAAKKQLHAPQEKAVAFTGPQSLENLLRSGPYADLSSQLEYKQSVLLDLLTHPAMPFTTPMLLDLYAQTLRGALRAKPNPARARAASQRKPRIAADADLSSSWKQHEDQDIDASLDLFDAPLQAWTMEDVPQLTRLLRAIHTRLDMQMRDEAADGQESTAAKAAPTLPDSNVSLVLPLKPPQLESVRAIVHLMISHFRSPSLWGSHFGALAPAAPSRAPPPPLSSAERLTHADLFHCCMETLIVLMPSLLGQPTAALLDPVPPLKRTRDWLLGIVSFEVRQSVQQLQLALQPHRPSTPSIAPDALIRSTLACCHSCRFLPGAGSTPACPGPPPYGTLSPSGSAALALLTHSFCLQGVDEALAQDFVDLFSPRADSVAPALLLSTKFPPVDFASPAAQLTFLAHVQPPLLRLHLLALALGVAFDPRFNLNATLFTFLPQGLQAFPTRTDEQRLSHAFLEEQLNFALRWLQYLSERYDHAAQHEHDQLVDLRRQLSFVPGACAQQPATSVSIRERSTRQTAAETSTEQKASATPPSAAHAVPATPASTAAAKSKPPAAKQLTMEHAFGTQRVRKHEDDRARKLAEEQKLVDAATLKEQQAQELLRARKEKMESARQALRDTSARHTEAFCKLQRHYADLLAMFVASVSAIMHEHCNAVHGDQCSAAAAPLERNGSSASHASVCIPDSQPDDEHMDDAQSEPSLSQPSAAPPAAETAAAPGASKRSKSKSARSPAASKKLRAPLAPQPCQCMRADHTCPQLDALFRRVHAQAHEMQSAVVPVLPPPTTERGPSSGRSARSADYS